MRRLQERVARALPAERIVIADGWWLRSAPRCAWWVGTVLPHADADGKDLVRRVIEAEAFYAAQGAAATFQITPGACPDRLDRLLADRGYDRVSPVSLQVATTNAAFAGRLKAMRVEVDEGPTRAWFDTWLAAQGHGGDPACEWELLGRVTQPSAYARVVVGGETVAVGRGVADGGWAGVFGMATLPQARGQGAARQVLAALAAWAAERGCDRMYLQVERDNEAALRLYGRAGFGQVCVYHYRVRRGPA